MVLHFVSYQESQIISEKRQKSENIYSLIIQLKTWSWQTLKPWNRILGLNNICLRAICMDILFQGYRRCSLWLCSKHYMGNGLRLNVDQCLANCPDISKRYSSQPTLPLLRISAACSHAYRSPGYCNRCPPTWGSVSSNQQSPLRVVLALWATTNLELLDRWSDDNMAGSGITDKYQCELDSLY